MKGLKHFLILSCILALGACSEPYGTDKDIAELRKMLMGSRDSWNAGNVRGYMSFYENVSQTQFISRKGRTTGWEQTLNMYLKAYPDKASMGRLEFTEDTIRILSTADKLGQVTGRWKLFRASDTPQGFFSLITRKKADGSTKIMIDHTW